MEIILFFIFLIFVSLYKNNLNANLKNVTCKLVIIIMMVSQNNFSFHIFIMKYRKNIKNGILCCVKKLRLDFIVL